MDNRHILSRELDWGGVPVLLVLKRLFKNRFCISASLFFKEGKSIHSSVIKEVCLCHTFDVLEAIMEFHEYESQIKKAIKELGSWYYNDIDDRAGVLNDLIRSKEFAF